MKAYIGVDADSGLMHTVRSTAGHMADVTEGNALLHGEETVVFADAGYQGADKRLDAVQGVRWQVAMLAGKRKNLDKANIPIDALMDKIEKCKPVSGPRSSTRFASIKRQFGYVKVRYRDLKKHTLQLKALFALFPPVDGTPPTDGRTGMSGLKNRTSASSRVEKVQTLSVQGIQKVWIESRRLLLNNIKPVTSLPLSCSDLL